MNAKKLLLLVFALLSAVGLVACGDDVTNSNQVSEKIGLSVVSAKKDLDSCTKSLDGYMAYVTETGELLFCLDGSWAVYGKGEIPVYVADDGEDGTDGVDGKDGTDGVDGKDGADGVDGKDGTDGVDGKDGTDGVDGKDGTDGVDGKDGSSCTGEYNADSTGVNIYCGGTLVGTIWNGSDGTDGSNGKNGSDGGVTASIEFNTAETFSMKDTVWSYQDSLIIRIDNRDISDSIDTVKVRVTSTSDSVGLVLQALRSDDYFFTKLFFTSEKSDSTHISVRDGDTVVVSFEDDNPKVNVVRNVAFVLRDKSSQFYLKFDKNYYYGDSAQVLITLNDASLDEDSVSVSLVMCYKENYECHYYENYGGALQTSCLLHGGNGFYQGTLLLVNEGENHDNVYVADSTKTLTLSIQRDSKTAESKWAAHGNGRVELDADSYKGTSKAGVYVFEASSTEDSLLVTVTSKVAKDTLETAVYRSGEYFYGTFEMSLNDIPERLKIDKEDTVVVVYVDSSTHDESTDFAKVFLDYSITLTFGDTLYNDVTDKAVLKLSDNSLTLNDKVQIGVYSYSSSLVYVDMYPVPSGDGTERIGFVEFTRDETYKGCFENCEYLYVSALDSVRAEYNKKTSDGKILNAYTMWKEVSYGSFMDSRDSNVYRTVTFMGQTWMAENLRYNEGGRHIKSDSATYYATYGKFYNWAWAMKNTSCTSTSLCNLTEEDYPVQGLCPTGWQLPDTTDFRQFNENLSDFKWTFGEAGTLLKSTTGWVTSTDAEIGRDIISFAAYPTGYYSSSTEQINFGYSTCFWTSNEEEATYAYTYCLKYDDNTFYRSSGIKSNYHAIRCVKDLD